MFGPFLSAIPELHTPTLLIAASCVTALLTILLLFAWVQEQTKALAWWGAAYAAGCLSIVLWSFEDRGAVAAPSASAGATLILSCAMVWNAARLFHGRALRIGAMFAGPALWIAVSLLLHTPQADVVAFALASLIVAAYAYLTAAELLTERRAGLRRWPAVIVPTLHGAMFLLPIMMAGALPSGWGFAEHGWTAVFLLQTMLYAVGTAFVVLMLAKGRTVQMHKTAAVTDPLTGLANRRGLGDAIERLSASQARRNRPMTAIVFDLDRFKMINDRFGHAVGDEALRVFGKVAATNIRVTDFIARTGGEEFVVIITGGLDEGLIVAERVRIAFELKASTIAGRFVGATVSAGVASQMSNQRLDALLDCADGALFEAKRSGRNMTVGAGNTPFDDLGLFAEPSPTTLKVVPSEQSPQDNVVHRGRRAA